MNESIYEIKKVPAFRVMGLKSNVSFTDIETIKDSIQHLVNRRDEFESAVNLNVRWGLSYHLRPDRFVYYSVYEVQDSQQLLKSMVEINIPEMTYLVTKHAGGSIEATYGNIMEWIQHSDYVPYKEQGIEYYDALPIKYEKHPKNSDPNDPHFEILIPVVKR